jgi:pimeloyl-ACP methyl ester carboxylesterase
VSDDAEGPAGERIDVGDVTLNVVDVGQGPAVLLLHGFPDRAAMWRHQIRALTAAGHRVIAPDLRGFGDSDRPSGVEAYRMPAIMGDLFGLLDHLGIDEVAVAGHDWGALVGWLLASTAPDRVEKLAALSVGHPRAFAEAGITQLQLSWYVLWWQFPGVAESQLPTDDWRFYRDWAFEGAARADDVDLDRQLTDLERPGALTAGLNWYRANLPPESFAASDRHQDLPPVRCPVLGIWSDREMALTEEQMVGSERYVTGPWRYERLAGVGHWIPVHEPRITSELLVDFFR